MRPSLPVSVVQLSGIVKVKAGSSTGNSTFFACRREAASNARSAAVRSEWESFDFMPRFYVLRRSLSRQHVTGVMTNPKSESPSRSLTADYADDTDRE